MSPYSANAITEEAQGTVKLLLTIDADGNVKEVKTVDVNIVSGASKIKSKWEPKDLQTAAVEDAKTWRFEKGSSESKYSVEFVYSLHKKLKQSSLTFLPGLDRVEIKDAFVEVVSSSGLATQHR